jgi:phage shock protein PspC (stress-responsive transcriptional regulator)
MSIAVPEPSTESPALPDFLTIEEGDFVIHRLGSKTFRLDKTNGKIFGVCAGIGDYFGIDPMLVRIGFAAGALLGFGTFILIYLAVALIAD